MLAITSNLLNGGNIMKKGRIIIITGSPGTGKSTISSILAKESNMSKSVNMQTDDFIIIFLKVQYLHIYQNQTNKT